LGQFPKGIIALDLEMTGLSALIDNVVEIAAVKLLPDRTIEQFVSYINPEIPMPEETFKIHGISDEMVKDAPKFEEVLPQLIEFLGDFPILAHSAQFDLGFIFFALHKNKLQLAGNDVHCSCKYSRHINKKTIESHKLSKLAIEYNIDPGTGHRALSDTITCLSVFSKTIERSIEKNKKAFIDESYLFNTNDFSIDSDLSLPDYLKEIKAKVRKQQIIQIKYKGGTHKGKLRPIRPISLLPMPSGNILYAHCLLSNIYKSFLIRKISEMKIPSQEEIEEILKSTPAF
jgi:DNA polymerase III subunit epsilon